MRTPPLTDRDERYRELLLAPVRLCADYLPKMGGSHEVDVAGFRALYGTDPLYHWVGLDSDVFYAAHKAAGGMTSIYRQLGIGSERLFRAVLRDELGLSEDQVKWSYEVLPDDFKDDVDEAARSTRGSKSRILSLDGRVEMGEVSNAAASARIADWVERQKGILGVSAHLKGTVFEVRQGYKSADSKRQNADLSNAAQALGHGYLPTLVIMSTQINQVVLERYRIGRWAVLRGTLDPDDLTSTWAFLRDTVGYDLPSFFDRNTAQLRAEFTSIVEKLLEAR